MKLGVYLNAQHPGGGDPAHRFAETIEQVRLIRALGFDSIWGGMAQKDILAGIERLGHEVLPEVRRRTSRAAV